MRRIDTESTFDEQARHSSIERSQDGRHKP
jgi:hypothetical protein